MRDITEELKNAVNEYKESEEFNKLIFKEELEK